VAPLAISPAVQEDFRRDLVVPHAVGFIAADAGLIPVAPMGSGIARGNARQSVRTYHILKAAIDTVYTQVATVSAGVRVFFIGVQSVGTVNLAADSLYIEDADSGNIAPSDASTVALYYVGDNGTAAAEISMMTPPRECKRGIRVRTVRGTTDEMSAIIYWMIERTDGQQQPL